MEKTKKDVNNYRDYLRLSFGKQYKIWLKCADDRKLFCNIYETLMESLDEMENVSNNLVWVAYHEKFREEYQMLKNIKERFS